MDTLHIKLNPRINQSLKRLAKERHQTVSELIRQALMSCFQLELIDLPQNQRQAIEAFRGGYISLGKLSELMGNSIVDTRKWLNEHGISQNTSYSEDDVKHARK